MTWRYLGVLYVAVVLSVTLIPGGSAHQGWIHGCLVCGSQGWADAVRNLILFVPLGFFLAQGWGRGAWTVLACLALTVAIEAIQIVVPGRDSSVGDIIFNGVGGTLGVALANSASLWFRPGTGLGRVLGLSWSAAVGLGMVFLGWAAGASVIVERPIGQWTPRPRGTQAYTGMLLEARVGEHAIPAWYLPSGEESMASWVEGTPVQLRFLAGTPPAGSSLLLRVVGLTNEALSLGLLRDGVQVRMRSRLADLRLHDPVTRIEGVMSSVAPGDTVGLSVWRDGDHYCAEVLSFNGLPAQGASERCVVGLTTGRAWGTVIPPDAVPRGLQWVATGAWLALLAAPAGWWLGTLWGLGAGLGLATVSGTVARYTLLSSSWPHMVSLVMLGVLGGLLRARLERGPRGEPVE